MCAIIGWKGNLPKGLMTRLFVESEERGKDSTGVAFRVAGKNVAYRQAVPASTFVRENPKNMGDARRSLAGIGHTRRASRGMPINNQNAHPFGFWKYFYVHNGFVQNWKEIKDLLKVHYMELKAKAIDQGNEEAARQYEYYYEFVAGATTDSMILGPYIDARDFSSIIGCMALAWIRGENVYTFRVAKEAVAANVMWRYKEEVDGQPAGVDQMITIVASTGEILEKAFLAVSKIEYNIKWMDYDEGHVYRIDATGLVDEGAVPNARGQEDYESSVAGNICEVVQQPEPEDAFQAELEMENEALQHTMTGGQDAPQN